MRTVAIIQARMGSSRLPGKVLTPLAGIPALERMIRRLKRAISLDEIVVATTVAPADDAVKNHAQSLGVRVFRGSEEDVLDRYREAAKAFSADTILRLTADCPLLDPVVVDLVTRRFFAADVDYGSNRIERTYPRGQDTEVMTREALERAWERARQKYERVHVTPYIYEHPEEFRICSVTGGKDWSAQRWTIDTERDLKFMLKVHDTFDVDTMTFEELVQALANRPDILALNADEEQRSMHDV